MESYQSKPITNRLFVILCPTFPPILNPQTIVKSRDEKEALNKFCEFINGQKRLVKFLVDNKLIKGKKPITSRTLRTIEPNGTAILEFEDPIVTETFIKTMRNLKKPMENYWLVYNKLRIAKFNWHPEKGEEINLIE